MRRDAGRAQRIIQHEIDHYRELSRSYRMFWFKLDKKTSNIFVSQRDKLNDEDLTAHWKLGTNK